MEYTQQPLSFKVRKVLRYVRLYGLSRTIAKVRSHYHYQRRYSVLPAPRRRPRPWQHVGIMGCGKFAYAAIAYYLTKNYGPVIRGVMDLDVHRAASLFTRYDAGYYTTEPEEILDDPSIDLIFIASNHASHAEYAIRALERHKSVHVEKPHVVSVDQLVRLCSAMSVSRGKVAVGFNRPKSRIGVEIKRALECEAGPAMYNWFVAGHAISHDHWYFKKEEGGRVLGNLCHWTDFLYQLVASERRYPITIHPTAWEGSDSDIAVTYLFGDGSIGAITFSAKGHTFEGVRERFAAHRGNVLISMEDFRRLVIERGERRTVLCLPFRDHGHERKIRDSYEMVRPRSVQRPGCRISYVWESAELFLETKRAVEERRVVTVSPYAQARLTVRT